MFNDCILLEGLFAVTETKTWMCLICGWIYDEATGDPEHGVAPGTAWSAVPGTWTCPECGGRKEDFEMVQLSVPALNSPPKMRQNPCKHSPT